MLCSRTGVPVCAAFTMVPALTKIPVCTTWLEQSPFSPQKSKSPGWAWARGMCLPRFEWYCVWAVRATLYQPTCSHFFLFKRSAVKLTNCLLLRRVHRILRQAGAVEAALGRAVDVAAAPDVRLALHFLGRGNDARAGALVQMVLGLWLLSENGTQRMRGIGGRLASRASRSADSAGMA